MNFAIVAGWYGDWDFEGVPHEVADGTRKALVSALGGSVPCSKRNLIVYLRRRRTVKGHYGAFIGPRHVINEDELLQGI